MYFSSENKGKQDNFNFGPLQIKCGAKVIGNIYAYGDICRENRNINSTVTVPNTSCREGALMNAEVQARARLEEPNGPRPGRKKTLAGLMHELAFPFKT